MATMIVRYSLRAENLREYMWCKSNNSYEIYSLCLDLNIIKMLFICVMLKQNKPHWHKNDFLCDNYSQSGWMMASGMRSRVYFQPRIYYNKKIHPFVSKVCSLAERFADMIYVTQATFESAQWLLMAWYPFGTRTSATAILHQAGRQMVGVPQHDYFFCYKINAITSW